MGVSREVRALQQAFVGDRVEEFARAGKKLPRGYREAYKSKSPAAKAYYEIVNFSVDRGMSGGAVCAEWLDPILGRYRFTACAGVRPYRGKAAPRRKNPTEPWGPGNFHWVKPGEPAVRRRDLDEEEWAALGLTVAEIMQHRKALAARRREHRELLVRMAKEIFGLELSPSLFRRGEQGTSGLYGIWYNIVDRCENPESKDYPNYGGRGIELYPQWSPRINRDFAFEDYVYYVYTCPQQLGARPGSRWSTERINTDGNYEPENLRWATTEEQNANRRKVLERRMSPEEKAEARLAEVARTAKAKERWQLEEMLASGAYRIAGEDGDVEPIPEDEAAPPKPWPDTDAGEVEFW